MLKFYRQHLDAYVTHHSHLWCTYGLLPDSCELRICAGPLDYGATA